MPSTPRQDIDQMYDNDDNVFIMQEGGFVPECIRRPEIGLDLEIFNSNAVSDIQERMANFNELNFYDGTLNTNLSLEEAHAKVEMMRDEVVKKADKVRNLPGSSYSGPGGGSGGGAAALSLMEKRKLARKKKSRRASSISTIKASFMRGQRNVFYHLLQAGELFNLDGEASSSG